MYIVRTHQPNRWVQGTLTVRRRNRDRERERKKKKHSIQIYSHPKNLIHKFNSIWFISTTFASIFYFALFSFLRICVYFGNLWFSCEYSIFSFVCCFLSAVIVEWTLFVSAYLIIDRWQRVCDLVLLYENNNYLEFKMCWSHTDWIPWNSSWW